MSDNAARAALVPQADADSQSKPSVELSITQLVADHHARLYRYAYRLSGSAADAEDLVQQVFLIAHQKLDQLRDGNCASGWLHTVLRNCYLKGCRKDLGLPLAELDVSTLPAEPPVDVVDSEALQAAIETLEPEFKVVVLMFYFEEKSYREIADCLAIPLGTVMSRLSRAKAHLRARLAAGGALEHVSPEDRISSSPSSRLSFSARQ